MNIKTASWIKPELRDRVARKAATLPDSVVLVGEHEPGVAPDAEVIKLDEDARLCLAHAMVTGHCSLEVAFGRFLKTGLRRALGLKSLHPVVVERRFDELAGRVA